LTARTDDTGSHKARQVSAPWIQIREFSQPMPGLEDPDCFLLKVFLRRGHTHASSSS